MGPCKGVAMAGSIVSLSLQGLPSICVDYRFTLRCWSHSLVRMPTTIIRYVRLILALFIVFGVVPEDAIGGQRGYKIALGFPFPPWDVGRLEGVNYDLLSAICAANTGVRCTIVDSGVPPVSPSKWTSVRIRAYAHRLVESCWWNPVARQSGAPHAGGCGPRVRPFNHLANAHLRGPG